MKFILTVLMVISAMRAGLVGATMIGDLITRGVFRGQDLMFLIDAFVIFWLACAYYGSITREDVARNKISLLASELGAYRRKTTHDSTHDERDEAR